VIREPQLDNLNVYHGRIEEYIESGVQEKFDIVFSRALGDLYTVIEWGGPLLKRDGLLYIYSHMKKDELPAYVRDHCIPLGLTIAADVTRYKTGIDGRGLLFVKSGNTESRYPRKTSIIKREILRMTRSEKS
jgi:16S rRNA G527 N7-methylase RsmG